MIRKRTVYLYLHIVLLPILSVAQQPLNLGFERASVEGPLRPWGWEPKSFGTIRFTMDSMVVKSGQYSLIAESKSAEAPAQELTFSIESFQLRGKLLRLTGLLKTEGLAGEASLRLGYTTADVNDASFHETAVGSKKLSGNSNWSSRYVSLLIPENANTVFVSVRVSGKGKAWFDELQLSVGGKFIQTVEVAAPLSADQENWLNASALPIRTVVPEIETTSSSSFNDLAGFRKNLGSARLLALGEATHGTREFFQLKHRLFQFAVTEMGFRVFALEDNQLAVEKINAYVHSGKGTAREAMSGLFAVWYTTEVEALIDWVCQYNQRHPDDPVSFVGFDIQQIDPPVDSLMAFLQRRAPDLLHAYEKKLLQFKREGSNPFAVSDSSKKESMQFATALYDSILLRKADWMKTAEHKSDRLALLLGIQYGNLVKQFVENSYRGHWSLFRDKAMADNINWLLDSRFPDLKIVVWAHDVHISRGDHPNPQLNLNNSISMGSFLSKRWTTNFRSYGLATAEGAYLAMTSYTNFTKVNCPLFNAPRGSLDEALHRIAKTKQSNLLFLALPRTLDWLSAAMPKRFANHVSIDYGYWERISLPYQFDGIFFVNRSNPAQYLMKR